MVRTSSRSQTDIKMTDTLLFSNELCHALAIDMITELQHQMPLSSLEPLNFNKEVVQHASEKFILFYTGLRNCQLLLLD